MDREKILEQSRKTATDERVQAIEKESGFYGLLAVIVLAIIFEIYKIIKGMPYRDMAAIICAQLAATSLYKYKKLEANKSYLIGAIAAGVATVVATVFFFIGE